MDSKYKEKIEDILLNIGYRYLDNFNIQRIDVRVNELIHEICQLAEEVESNSRKSTLVDVMCYLGDRATNDDLRKMFEYHKEEKYNLYTKEQVEELLQKQRELCAEKANLYYTDLEQTVENIDVYSILNAKFKF